MLHLKDIKNQLPNEVSAFFSELKITKFLYQAGIRKQKGYSVSALFIFIFCLVFKGKSINQMVTGRESDQWMKKDSIYRFMNDATHNWRKFLSLLSAFVVTKIHELTSAGTHLRVLTIDDSSFYRNRSKKVTGLAKQWDHANQKVFKGFRMLTLGFSDGFSFIPLDFCLLSSQKKVSSEQEKVDRRTSGGKRLLESEKPMPEVAVEMVDRALNNGVYATHVLMDKWFTCPKIIDKCQKIGIHIIGMVKNGNTKYLYQKRLYTLAELFTKSTEEYHSDAIISSIIVKTPMETYVKIVFVRNQNKKSAWLAIMTDDLQLTSQEIVKTYRVRWDTEVFFKATKSLLNLAKETQTRNYNALICHTTIVFTRYILLSWQQRCSNDERTLGGLFFEFSDEIKDLDWSVALVDLVKLIHDISTNTTNKIKNLIENQLQNWIASLPSYIKAYLPVLVCET